MNIRIQPPATKKRTFKGKKEISSYIFSHKVIGLENDKSVLEFFEEMSMRFGNFESLIEEFLMLWPLEYQNIVRCLFNEKYKKKT